MPQGMNMHPDSWEVEGGTGPPRCAPISGAARLRLLPWLPVIAGRIVNSRDESNRFLAISAARWATLAIAKHTAFPRRRAPPRAVIHPSSRARSPCRSNARQCLGFNDAPMSEFWAASWKHRVGEADRFFVKQPAPPRTPMAASSCSPRFHDHRAALAGDALGQPQGSSIGRAARDSIS